MSQLMISLMMMVMSIMFIQMNHPLAMGVTLLMQTLLTCMITGMMMQSFWFSYILFLIFLGGVLVLFMYVTSIASNEMFQMSLHPLTMFIGFFLMLLTSMILFDPIIMSNFMTNSETSEISSKSVMLKENIMNLIKIYNYPTNFLTLMLIIYLLISLVVIVKITNLFYGPLRPMN